MFSVLGYDMQIYLLYLRYGSIRWKDHMKIKNIIYI